MRDDFVEHHIFCDSALLLIGVEHIKARLWLGIPPHCEVKTKRVVCFIPLAARVLCRRAGLGG
ncbi:MAG: hypothetical protein DRP52_05955, partial [Planctomycetota bacterium]